MKKCIKADKNQLQFRLPEKNIYSYIMNRTKGRGCYASKNGHSVHHQQMSSQLTDILSIFFPMFPGVSPSLFGNILEEKKLKKALFICSCKFSSS